MNEKFKDKKERYLEYLNEFCRKLELSNKTKIFAMKILDSYGKLGTKYEVAGAIWISSIINNERRTQLEIARELDITEAPIKSHGDKIKELDFVKNRLIFYLYSNTPQLAAVGMKSYNCATLFLMYDRVEKGKPLCLQD